MFLMIGRFCRHCKAIFFDYRTNYRRFCSRKCFELDRIRRNVKSHTHVCPQCGESFYDRRKINRKFCSKKCKAKYEKGRLRPRETSAKIKTTLRRIGITHSGGLYVDKDGFVKITGTSKNLHTAIAENILGRGLFPNEVVHHINENRTDNRNCNLVICERSLHPTIHARMRIAAKSKGA